MADDATPDSAELASPDLVLGPVHEAHTLAKVELSGRLVPDVLDLEKRGVLMLVAKPPLETHHDALHVQPVHDKSMHAMHQAERNAAIWGRKRGKTNAHRSHRFHVRRSPKRGQYTRQIQSDRNRVFNYISFPTAASHMPLDARK